MESMGTVLVELDRATADGQTTEESAGASLKRELARELHDSVAQTLTSMLIELEVFRRDQQGRASVQTAIDVFQQSTRQVLMNLREVLYDLRDQRPDDDHFAEEIRACLEDAGSQHRVRTSLDISGSWPRRLTGTAALQLRRIIQESVQNARLHGRASRVSVALKTVEGHAEVSVSDNGIGAVPDQLTGGGLGIMGMKERAILLGGRLTIETLPRAGTTVRLLVPIAAIAAL